MDRNTLVLIYNALVQPHFDYCCEVWDVLGKTLLAHNSLGWINLEERRAQIKAKLMYKSINNLAPERLSNLFLKMCNILQFLCKL